MAPGVPPAPGAAAGPFLAPAEQSTPLCGGKWEGKRAETARTVPRGCFCRDRAPTASQRGHPPPAQAPTAADPLFSGGSVPAPRERPWLWVRPGRGRQLMSSSPRFSHLPFFFFFFWWCLSHVTAWASKGFLPPRSLARRLLQMPSSKAAACWKGAPKIGWRAPGLARLRGSWKHAFLLWEKGGKNKSRMPLPTAGPKNESGICTAAIEPGTARPRGLAGDTGTPSVLPVCPCCPSGCTHANTPRVALLGDGGDFLGLSLGLGRHRRCRGEEEEEEGDGGDKGPGTRRARNKTKHQMVSTSA